MFVICLLFLTFITRCTAVPKSLFKENMQTWTKTIKLTDKKKLRMVTKVIKVNKVI